MNASDNTKTKVARTNKITTTVIVGMATLVIGLMIGAATAETGTGLLPDTKKPATAANQISSAATSNPQSGALPEWNPFQEIRDMQAQMDRSFDRMSEQFRTTPQFNIFQPNAGYSLSLEMRDLKNHYEVRAYLPDAKASNVHVSLKNNQTLNVQVSGKQTESSDQKNVATRVMEFSQYDQTIQLPTPVKADQMKIKHEGHELVITIPKAA